MQAEKETDKISRTAKVASQAPRDYKVMHRQGSLKLTKTGPTIHHGTLALLSAASRGHMPLKLALPLGGAHTV